MSVPKMVQLAPGKSVNIILKADQRTGTLTAGQIADILTRGDHPRGIKVRLTDGQIGRVQSLTHAASATRSPSAKPSTSQPPTFAGQYGQQSDQANATHLKMAQDMRYDGHDLASREDSTSLADYVKPRKQKRAKRAIVAESSNYEEASITPQESLEKAFPKVDTALIAAILADYPDTQEAREVLSKLEGNSLPRA